MEDIPQFAMVDIGESVLEEQRGIVDHATENDVDCIVVASHQLGFADIFLGSTATKIVRHGTCSVHVIR